MSATSSLLEVFSQLEDPRGTRKGTADLNVSPNDILINGWVALALPVFFKN